VYRPTGASGSPRLRPTRWRRCGPRRTGEPETETALYRSAEVLLANAGGHLWHGGGLHPLLRRFGPHLTALGRPAAARDMAQGLADQARRRLGDGHRDVLTLRSQAAQAGGDLGDITAAVRSLAEIRREAEDRLGRADPDTLSIRLHEARFRMESGLIEAALADFVAWPPRRGQRSVPVTRW
jgi:hypothetical protein